MGLIHQQIGGNMRMPIQFWREIAYAPMSGVNPVCSPEILCQPAGVAGCSSKQPTTICQDRYPSPIRSGVPDARPDPFSHWGPKVAGISAENRPALQIVIAYQGTKSDSAPCRNTSKGSKKCLKPLSLSQPSPFSACRLVSTAILSADLSARPLAPLSRMPWAAMPPPARLSAGPQASCVTMPTWRVAGNSIRPSGRPIDLNRRRGRIASAAVLHSRGPI